MEQVLRILSVCCLNLYDSIAKGLQYFTRFSAMHITCCIREIILAMRSISNDDDIGIARRLETICVQDDRLKDFFMD